MTEVIEIHNLSLEWGAVLNLATRIADIEDRIGPWDDLTNMVARLLDNHRTSSPQALAQEVYPFLFRLYFRLKPFTSPIPFNQVFKEERLVPASPNSQYKDAVPGYRISNYDFATFRWAIALKQDDYIDNNSLWIPASALTSAQAKRLEKKTKENA